jgi:drug/metabolite transporter (DMT)-like permease
MTNPTGIKLSMGPRTWAILVALSVLWGGTFFFVEIAVKELPPFTIVAVRVGLAAIALWAVVAVMGIRVWWPRRVWAAFFGMGVLNNAVPFTLLVWGQTQIASGLASILNATTPLFGVLVAGVVLADERLTPSKAIGAAVGFAGAVVMIGPTVLEGLGENVLAQLACLGAALSYAFAGVFGRRFSKKGIDPVMTATGQVTASAIVLIPVALIVDRPWALAMPGAVTVTSVIALALASTALAYILYFRILASSGATNILLVTFLVPVSAIVLGTFILGERLEAVHFAGMALIGLGLATIDGRLWRRLVRRRLTRSRTRV